MPREYQKFKLGKDHVRLLQVIDAPKLDIVAVWGKTDWVRLTGNKKQVMALGKALIKWARSK